MRILLLLLVVLVSSNVFAQQARLLPVGDAVSFNGAQCGRIRFKWVAGELQRDGRFISYSSLIKAVNSRISRTTNPKELSALKKQRSSYSKRRNRDQPTCNSFDTGLLPPSRTQSAAPGHTTINWSKTLADNVQYPIGADFKFFCPPSGESNLIWGTFFYSTDSSVCYAAVHAGLITMKNGGNVTVRTSAGLQGYKSGLRSGVKSASYPSWTKTFAFVNPSNNLIVQTSAPIVIPWDSSMGNYRGTSESQFTFVCPANGQRGSLWGTDTYTDDSSICTAAVHRGRINFRRGGAVKPTKAPGQSSYLGSTRNGITSSSYGTWGGSFSIE